MGALVRSQLMPEGCSEHLQLELALLNCLDCISTAPVKPGEGVQGVFKKTGLIPAPALGFGAVSHHFSQWEHLLPSDQSPGSPKSFRRVPPDTNKSVCSYFLMEQLEFPIQGI